MHSPLSPREKIGVVVPVETKWAWPSRSSLAVLVLIVALAAAGVAAYFERGPLQNWIMGPQAAAAILVSGNIEAHQAVLGFKTVQSRIVELPFDEGQWVDAGTLIARLDDSDYRQQVAINEAALEMQQRQLAAAEQNLAAAERTVEFDAADLEFREAEYKRADFLLQNHAGTVEQRDQTYAAWRQSTAAHERDQALRERRRTPGRTRPSEHPQRGGNAQTVEDRARLHGFAGAFFRRHSGAAGGAW